MPQRSDSADAASGWRWFDGADADGPGAACSGVSGPGVSGFGVSGLGVSGSGGAGAMRPPDLDAAFARCFSTPDGARVLAALTDMTLGRALGPESSNAALRQLEGQRRLVSVIRAAVERGRRKPG